MQLCRNHTSKNLYNTYGGTKLANKYVRNILNTNWIRIALCYVNAIKTDTFCGDPLLLPSSKDGRRKEEAKKGTKEGAEEGSTESPIPYLQLKFSKLKRNWYIRKPFSKSEVYQQT